MYQLARLEREDHTSSLLGKRVDAITAAVAKLFGQLERNGLTPPPPEYDDEADERSKFEYETVVAQRRLAMERCRLYCLAEASAKAAAAHRLTDRAARGMDSTEEDGDG